MGTSSSFGGPSKNPLLPDDYNDNSWKNAKTEFGKYMNNSGGDPSSLFGKYVKASGGAKALANSSIGGKAGFSGINDFIAQVNDIGLKATLDSFRLLSEGKTLDEALSELAGIIAPIGKSKEEAVARKATIDTMMTFYDMIDEQNLDIEEANSISSEFIDDLLFEYLKNYITGLLLKDLGYGVEKYVEDPEMLSLKEQELRDFVDSKIYVMLKNSQLNQPTDKIIDTVFEGVMEIIGGNYE